MAASNPSAARSLVGRAPPNERESAANCGDDTTLTCSRAATAARRRPWPTPDRLNLVLSLADGRWVRDHLNVLICGPTGVGKSWIACPLAHSACRHGHRALYLRAVIPALQFARHRSRRRTLPEAARLARQDPGPRARRLGALPAQRRAPARPARSPRGPTRRTVTPSPRPSSPTDQCAISPILCPSRGARRRRA